MSPAGHRDAAHPSATRPATGLTGSTPYAVVRSLAGDAPTRGSPSPGEVVLAEPPDGTGHLPRPIAVAAPNLMAPARRAWGPERSEKVNILGAERRDIAMPSTQSPARRAPRPATGRPWEVGPRPRPRPASRGNPCGPTPCWPTATNPGRVGGADDRVAGGTSRRRPSSRQGGLGPMPVHAGTRPATVAAPATYRGPSPSPPRT